MTPKLQNLFLRLSTGLLAGVLLLFAVSASASTTANASNAGKRNRFTVAKDHLSKAFKKQLEKKKQVTKATAPKAKAKKKTVAVKKSKPVAKKAVVAPIKILPKKKVITGEDAIAAEVNAAEAFPPAADPQKELKALLPKKTSAPTETPKRTSFGASLSRSRNLYDTGAPAEYQEGTSLGLRAGLKLSDWSMGVRVSYDQVDKAPESSDWSNTSISLSKAPTSISSKFDFGYGFQLIVPTSKDARIRQSLLGGIGTSANFALKPEVLAPGFDVSGSLSLTRLAHEYETASNGPVNTQWAFSQSVGASYTYKTFSFSADFVHRNGLGYQGHLREAFSHSQEIRWAPQANTSLAIGHSLEGPARKANGIDSNIGLTNENASVFYGTLAVSY